MYEVKNTKSFSAIKEIVLGANSMETIEQVIKEYAIMKLLSSLECAPVLNKIFGFDLIISDKCVYFEV